MQKTFEVYEPDDYGEPKSNIFKPLTIAVVIGLLAVAIGYFVASPYITLWSMRNAATAKDGKKFATFIDFPVFKENLKEEFNAFWMSKANTDGSISGNIVSGMVMAVAPAIVNNMVDGYVTPAGVERMMSGEFLPQRQDQSSTATSRTNIFNNENVTMGYESLNEFHVRVKTPENKIMSLIFIRHWLGDWKLSGIKMPR